LEAEFDVVNRIPQNSQSFQVAPYNYQYNYDNASATIFDDTVTHFNVYKGGQFQQALSAVTEISPQNFGGRGYATYGFEWWSNPKNRDEGYVA